MTEGRWAGCGSLHHGSSRSRRRHCGRVWQAAAASTDDRRSPKTGSHESCVERCEDDAACRVEMASEG